MIAISTAPTLFNRSVTHMAMTQNQPSFGQLTNEPADPGTEARACSCGFEAQDAGMPIYNEEAFRYFLDVERRRAEDSKRPFLLLLVALLKTDPDHDRTPADALFAALATCLRETDFVGLYHAESVIGAVLTKHAHSVGADAQAIVRDRVLASLRKSLPAAVAARVKARVYRLPPAVQDSQD
jgi:hypothetical protein